MRINGKYKRAALVLSGSGNLGAIQVGILRALFELGFRPNLIVGTSTGALNGAILAFYPNEEGLTRLARIWMGLSQKIRVAYEPLNLLRTAALKRCCLLGNGFLADILAENLPRDDFTAAEVPLYLVSTNLSRGTKQVFTSGRITDAVLASAAMPGLLCPVELNGDLYVDGAVMANLDLQTAVDAGAREILAIDLSGLWSCGETPSFLGVLTRSMDLLIRASTANDIERLWTRARITVIRVNASHALPADSHQADELIAAGEAIGLQMSRCCFDARGNLVPGIVVQLEARLAA